MYRKSLEMEQCAMDEPEIQVENDHECGDFVSRVTKLPVVRSMVTTTMEVYQKAKDSNGLVRFTLTNAEKTAQIAAEKAKPMVAKFEVPIGYVDVLACKTLDKLEKTVPIIKKTPEEIAEDSKKLYEETIVKPTLAKYNDVKDYGIGKVTAIKDYGVQTATTLANTKYGQMVTDTVDLLLVAADGYVDNYWPVPPRIFEEDYTDDVEDVMKVDDAGNTIEKALVLSRKLRQRMYYHGQVRMWAAKKTIDDILSNLGMVVDLATNMRSNLDDKNKALKEHFQKLWDEMDQTYPIENGPTPTLEQKLLYVAKRLTDQLHSTYLKLGNSLVYFPDKFQPSIQLVNDYVVDLYGQFAKAKSWNEIPGVVIVQLQDAIKGLQIVYSQLYDSALQTRPLSWMAKSKERPIVSNGSAVTCDGRTGDSQLPNDEDEARSDPTLSSTHETSDSDMSNDKRHDHSDENYQRNCNANEVQQSPNEHQN